jgi:hypothetical protein
MIRTRPAGNSKGASPKRGPRRTAQDRAGPRRTAQGRGVPRRRPKRAEGHPGRAGPVACRPGGVPVRWRAGSVACRPGVRARAIA